MSVHGYTNDEYVAPFEPESVTLISILDLSDPLHLHPNDSATLTIVSVKLKRTENYQIWYCAMMLSLEGKNKTGFIDESCRRSNVNENSILSRDPLPDVRDAYAIIFSEESHRVVSSSNSGTSQRSQSFMFNYDVGNFRGNAQRYQTYGNTSRPSNVTRPPGNVSRMTNGGPQLVCEIYGFNGHNGDRCFKFIGYPTDFGKRNNNHNNNQGVQNFNRRFTNNNSVGSSQTTFSDDQLSKIISLIKDNSLNSNGKGVQANVASTILNKSNLFQKNFNKFFCSHSQLHTALVAAGVIVDSGANQHLTYTDKLLVNVIDISKLGIKVSHPNGTEVVITKVGNMILNKNLTLYDVLVVPEYCVSLMSVHKVARDSGLIVAFNENKCFVLPQDLKGVSVLGIGNQIDGLYYLNDSQCTGLSFEKPICNLSKYIWHERLGHPSDQVLKVLENDLALDNSDLDHCEICQRAKQTREPFSLILRDGSHYPLYSSSTIDPSKNDLGHSQGSNGSVFEDKEVATSAGHNAVPEGDNVDSESVPTTTLPPVRRSERTSNYPSKYNEFIVESKVKYGLENFVGYVNLSSENKCFSIELNKSFEPKTFYEEITDLPTGRKAIRENGSIKLNVNNAFLYGDLDETVYMTLPEGYFNPGDNRVCRLKKSLYGLKQAPRQWNAKLTQTIVEHGFNQSKMIILSLLRLKMGIHIVKQPKPSLEAFVDADWAKCIVTKKSDLNWEYLLRVNLFCDSQAAIKIAANHVFHERTKHLEIDLHFVREKILSGVLKTQKINTADQTTDIFTKDEDDVPNLHFNTDLSNYFSFIDKTLTQCPTDVKLNKFKLTIKNNSDVYTRPTSQVYSWIRHAITRNVQEVDLYICDHGRNWENFTYDDELFFNNSCLTSIKVTSCVFSPPNGAIRWDKLKFLCIEEGELDEDSIGNILLGSPCLEILELDYCYFDGCFPMSLFGNFGVERLSCDMETYEWFTNGDERYEDSIGKILSGSPCLETLELKGCYGVRRIDVASKSVKNLVFSEYGIFNVEEDYIDTLDIDAPYMLSLTIKGTFWGGLESLCITCGGLDEDMLEKILSGSPCLETLNLDNCYGYRRINITSKSVKKFVFSGYDSNQEIGDTDYIDCIQINAPYISARYPTKNYLEDFQKALSTSKILQLGKMIVTRLMMIELKIVTRLMIELKIEIKRKKIPLDDVSSSVPTAIMPLDICHVKCTTPSWDRTNSYLSDGDTVHEDRLDPPGLIALKGCSSSEAYQLLNYRWAVAMGAYENPSTDLSEKPVMYSGSGGTDVEGSSHQIDFLSELRKAMNH
nr:ribonuclease H-like domain-containing protein [Tanacetum cinerariifolium]